jgi:hypothetical protein
MSDFLPEAVRTALRANQKKIRSGVEATGIVGEIAKFQEDSADDAAHAPRIGRMRHRG